MEPRRIGKYILGEELGSGSFAKVRLATVADTDEKFAVKILRRDVHPQMAARILAEYRIMRVLPHPNIVQLKEVLATEKNIYMVLEFCEGGELFDILADNGALGENQARSFFHQLIDAVDFCHRRGIFHRDLKPENILLTENGSVLKVADFGMANVRAPDGSNLLTTCTGSLHYCAPEIRIAYLCESSYDGSKVDTWSCGVLLFTFLTGYLPFDDDDQGTLVNLIDECKVQYPDFISEGARDLIGHLLERSPTKRFSTSQIKTHPWFRKGFTPFRAPTSTSGPTHAKSWDSPLPPTSVDSGALEDYSQKGTDQAQHDTSHRHVTEKSSRQHKTEPDDGMEGHSSSPEIVHKRSNENQRAPQETSAMEGPSEPSKDSRSMNTHPLQPEDQFRSDSSVPQHQPLDFPVQPSGVLSPDTNKPSLQLSLAHVSNELPDADLVRNHPPFVTPTVSKALTESQSSSDCDAVPAGTDPSSLALNTKISDSALINNDSKPRPGFSAPRLSGHFNLRPKVNYPREGLGARLRKSKHGKKMNTSMSWWGARDSPRGSEPESGDSIRCEYNFSDSDGDETAKTPSRRGVREPTSFTNGHPEKLDANEAVLLGNVNGQTDKFWNRVKGNRLKGGGGTTIGGNIHGRASLDRGTTRISIERTFRRNRKPGKLDSMALHRRSLDSTDPRRGGMGVSNDVNPRTRASLDLSFRRSIGNFKSNRGNNDSYRDVQELTDSGPGKETLDTNVANGGNDQVTSRGRRNGGIFAKLGGTR